MTDEERAIPLEQAAQRVNAILHSDAPKAKKPRSDKGVPRKQPEAANGVLSAWQVQKLRSICIRLEVAKVNKVLADNQ